MDVDFLDELAAFLDPSSSVRRVATPRKLTGVAECPSEDGDSLSQTSGSNSDCDKVSVRARKKPREDERSGDDRRKRYRDRVKNEREELKRLESALSLRVRELIDAREGRRTSERRDLALSKNFWRDLAGVQREQRLRAEAEQQRLVAAVQSQGAYIQNLCAVLPASASSNRAGNYKWLQLKSSDAAFVQAYLDEVGEIYARVDEVLEECGMESMPIGGMSSIRQHNLNGGVEYTQYMHKVLQPFNFEDTCTNAWKTSSLPHRQVDRQMYDVSDPANTIALKFRLKKTLATGTDVSILKRAVTRRFVAHERVVIVWRIFSEGEGIFSGMDLDETALISIRPFTDAEGEHSGALMEICSRQVPVRYLTTNRDDPAVKAYQTMLQDAIKEDEIETIRSLEKLLLEDTLAGLEI